VQSNGTIKALNHDGDLIVETLRLDNEDYTKFRCLILGIIRSLAKHDRATMMMLLSYPDDLPDLSKLRPLSNSKPQGVNNSCYARRSREELPETY
jgi:hypothetical protein